MPHGCTPYALGSCLRRQYVTFKVSGDLSDETAPESLKPLRPMADSLSREPPDFGPRNAPRRMGRS